MAAKTRNGWAMVLFVGATWCGGCNEAAVTDRGEPLPASPASETAAQRESSKPQPETVVFKRPAKVVESGSHEIDAGAALAVNTAAPGLKVVEVRPSWNDVYVIRGGESINLTNFTKPQVVFECEVSPDGNWAYVSHYDKPPRVLSIYNLRSLELSTRFVPGLTGKLCWVDAGQILHVWDDSETGGLSYAVYDLHGKAVLEGKTMAYELSPDKRFLATYPNTAGSREPLRVRDLRNMTAVCDQAMDPGLARVTGIDWSRTDTAVVSWEDAQGKGHEFTTSTLPQEKKR